MPVVILIKDEKVHSAFACKSDTHAEDVFKRVAYYEADKRLTPEQVDDGFVDLDTATLCIVHPVEAEDMIHDLYDASCDPTADTP